MKPWTFCFQWCISCVFACCLISQNSRFCFRNKYLKYILLWRRWVLLQENESCQLTLYQTFIVVTAPPLDTHTHNTCACACMHTHEHTHWFSIHVCSLHSYCLSVCVLLQYSLPLDLISREAFSQWMEIVRAVADRPVPEQTNSVDEEDRVDLPWWKCKKWALHILHRMFERSDWIHVKGEWSDCVGPTDIN